MQHTKDHTYALPPTCQCYYPPRPPHPHPPLPPPIGLSLSLQFGNYVVRARTDFDLGKWSPK